MESTRARLVLFKILVPVRKEITLSTSQSPPNTLFSVYVGDKYTNATRKTRVRKRLPPPPPAPPKGSAEAFRLPRSPTPLRRTSSWRCPTREKCYFRRKEESRKALVRRRHEDLPVPSIGLLISRELLLKKIPVKTRLVIPFVLGEGVAARGRGGHPWLRR